MEDSLDQQKRCSLIIVTYNSCSSISACLTPFVGMSDVEVVVVDNNSTDGTATELKKKFPAVTLITLQENTGFGRACNIGVGISRGSLVCFLNPDAVAPEPAFRALIGFLEEHPHAGIAGGRLIDPSGLPLQSMGDKPSLAGLLLDKPIAWMAKHVGPRGMVRRVLGHYSAKFRLPHEAEAVAWVSGAFLCCRRSTWDEIAGFDENFFLYYEDVDLCLRAAQAGWGVWYVPEAVVCHQSGASFAGNIQYQKQIYYANQRYFFQKHQGPLSAAFLSLGQDLYFRLGLFKHLAHDRIGRSVKREL